MPLSKPDITDREIAAVVETMRSPQLSLGPRLIEFEQRVASFSESAHAVAVSSGTAGLHLSLVALGISALDEVIVPSFTFIAAANTIRYVGAIPVFVDIDRATLNIDPTAVEAAITPRTRAILVVHTFGVPANLDALQSLAHTSNLLLIEDACEALGARYRGRPVGSFGRTGVFAFYPNKQLTTGEGGAIVTDDSAGAATLRTLRNQGRSAGDAWHQHTLLGYNYRLPEMACALGCVQMQRAPEILAARASVAETYTSALTGIPDVELAVTLTASERKSRTEQSWFVYVVRLGDGRTSTLRDAVLQRLATSGVQCGRYFAPIHQQPAYSNVPVRAALPETERESRRTLALPFYTRMPPSEISYVADALKSALQRT